MTPSRPINLPPYQPRYLGPMSRPDFGPRGTVPGIIGTPPAPPPSGEKHPLWVLLWATYDPEDPTDWTPGTLQSSETRKGQGAAVWLDALRTRVLARGGNPALEILETATHVAFHGEAVLDLAAMADVACFGHWIPKEIRDTVKARSAVGTRVLWWADLESLWQQPYYIPAQEQAAAAIRTSFAPLAILEGKPTGQLSAYGCTCVDKYETSPAGGGLAGCPHVPPHAGLSWPAAAGSAHTWDVDLWRITQSGSTASAVNVIALQAFAMLTLGMRTVDPPAFFLDGMCYDNVLDSPYRGTASLDYASDWATKYRAGWRAMLRAWYHAESFPGIPGAFLWGNASTGVGVYSAADLPNRYAEHFFRGAGPSLPKTWNEISANLEDVASSGLAAVVLGVNAPPGAADGSDAWARTAGGPSPSTGTWADIRSRCQQLGIVSRVLAPGCQTLPDGWLVYQSTWREPS